MDSDKKAKKNNKKKLNIQNMGVDIDKNEYREIVMSQSNHPERMDALLKDYRF
jgi:hypothetical protein